MKRFGMHLFGLGLLLLLLWPLGYAAWMSFTPSEILLPPRDTWSLRWYVQFFRSPQWTRALGNSLVVAVGSAGCSVAAGIGLATAMTRYRFRGQAILSRVVLMPMFVPTVVLGMGLLPWVRMLGLWGSFVSLAGAHAMWTLPVVYLVVRAALTEVDGDLGYAARGLGAGPVRTYVRVTLPLIGPGVAVAGLMAFILSLNEFAMALFLKTTEIETLPCVIWPGVRDTLTPLVAAASAVTMLLTLLCLIGSAWLLRLDRFVDHFLGRPR